jgi:hypothetical protein
MLAKKQIQALQLRKEINEKKRIQETQESCFMKAVRKMCCRCSLKVKHREPSLESNWD